MMGNNKTAVQAEKRTILLSWDELPEFMRVPEVRPYWEVLNRKYGHLRLKRVFDIVLSMVMIVVLAVPMMIIAIVVRLGSSGPVLYRQIRITQYGRKFKICKFRTMYDEAIRKGVGGQPIGNSVTVANDSRVTKAGRVLRKYRLDELPQLFNVLFGDMSFVGTRPEVPKYVERYEKEWMSTLLLPAGITSECSIRYKDEDKLLDGASDVDKAYIEKILPQKMKWNLKSLKKYSFSYEIGTIVRTVAAVAGKGYE